MDNPAIVAESSETIFFRRLQDNSSSTPVTTDSSILRDTLKVYGSMFLVLFSVFCCARVRYPRAFNVRSWADGLHNKLADTHYGFIDWAWNLWWISDDDFREACGMDALCFIRVLRFGLKISLLGMFNSLWLCPMCKCNRC
jgi:calcium permeable stress-gated cation channel